MTTDLTSRLLTARHQIGDRVILDWLELVRMSEPLTFGCRGRGVHIGRILAAWRCSQPMASRRLAAINATPPDVGLGRVERARGAHGWWRLLGVS
jgi:hypothetical protein